MHRRMPKFVLKTAEREEEVPDVKKFSKVLMVGGKPADQRKEEDIHDNNSIWILIGKRKPIYVSKRAEQKMKFPKSRNLENIVRQQFICFQAYGTRTKRSRC